MERILTTELPAHAGKRVLLQGWLHRTRRLSNVSFLILRDRAGLAQIVVTTADAVNAMRNKDGETCFMMRRPQHIPMRTL